MSRKIEYKKLKGIVVPIVTPFDTDWSVNYSSLKRICAFLVEKGVHGIFACGTTGEFTLLSLEERKKIAETVLDAVGDSTQTVIHVGTAQLPDTLELAEHAAGIGADGVGAVTPYYYRYNEKALYTYYSRIAEAVPDMSIYLYNIPSLTQNCIPPGMIRYLSGFYPNVVGLKDSSGSPETILDFLGARTEGFNIITGCDRLVLYSLMHGCEGIVTGPGGVFPEIFVKLYQAYTAGNYQEALGHQDHATAASKYMANGANFDLIKKAYKIRGIDAGSVRPPLPALSEGEEVSYLESLKEFAGKIGSTYGW